VSRAERVFRPLPKEDRAAILSYSGANTEHLIDPDHLTGVRIMTADDKGYLSIRNKWYAKTAGHGDFLALRPIYDSIDLRYGMSRLTICDKVIVTEGVTELLYLQGCSV
jgi:hypothetical protein